MYDMSMSFILPFEELVDGLLSTILSWKETKIFTISLRLTDHISVTSN